MIIDDALKIKKKKSFLNQGKKKALGMMMSGGNGLSRQLQFNLLFIPRFSRKTYIIIHKCRRKIKQKRENL